MLQSDRQGKASPSQPAFVRVVDGKPASATLLTVIDRGEEGGVEDGTTAPESLRREAVVHGGSPSRRFPPWDLRRRSAFPGAVTPTPASPARVTSRARENSRLGFGVEQSVGYRDTSESLRSYRERVARPSD